jgi:hypothetical protein
MAGGAQFSVVSYTFLNAFEIEYDERFILTLGTGSFRTDCRSEKSTSMQKPIILFCILLFNLLTTILPAQNDYFFPEGSRFDAGIPTPQEFLGYAIGDFHTRHDRMVSYMQELARVSDKASFQIIGYTNERRPQVILTITSPDNHARLEDIRREHLQLTRPGEAIPEFGNMPVITLLGYNVHGNEPSSTEAAMLTAYYLVASEAPETARMLRESVVLIDPAYNPDGRDRHTNWVNMHHAFPPVADPVDREHNEVWPGGRTNHYWFDLNRDWLPLAQVESRNRMEFYHRWLPNVATDYHEMGTNSTYFFEPTEAFGAENPLVPRRNYEELNDLFAGYFEEALNDIGSLYFTGESYDNSYPGYGNTYPDLHGGLGLLFEQASSRGHRQESTTEVVTFAFTIRNQVRTGIATVRAAAEHRERLLRYQREFFENTLAESKTHPVRAYVFGDAGDPSRTRKFTELLLRHRIETYRLKEQVEAGGHTYRTGEAFLVPVEQPQFKMVRTIFEPVTTFHDSVFYDASGWAVALAFNMPFAGLDQEIEPGAPLTMEDLSYETAAVPQAKYAYLFEWSDYQAPQALYYLLKKGVNVKSAFMPFSIRVDDQVRSFSYGTMMIPVADQSAEPTQLHQWVNEASKLAAIDFYTVPTGRSVEGVDLGSRHFQTVEQPKVAMLVGEGCSGYEAGEIWHLLDTRLNMPVTKIDLVDFNDIDWPAYNTLVMVSGSYRQLGDKDIQKIKDWTGNGGTLVLIRSAVEWAIKKKLVKERLLEEEKPDSIPERFDYVTARERRGARRIGGSVFRADLDITHPLGFGYGDRELKVYRNHNIFLLPSKDPYSTVVKYLEVPQLDGYIHPESLEKVQQSASVVVSPVGSSRAVLLCDNPNFRGFWYGTNRLFFNALFFGGSL